ncbi:hypothetical protein K439DRAFT_1632028 [Ramaria rubella]|nr:hypothetical protein K439DRAFT_1632028 [Ramaria rubella]
MHSGIVSKSGSQSAEHVIDFMGNGKTRKRNSNEVASGPEMKPPTEPTGKLDTDDTNATALPTPMTPISLPLAENILPTPLPPHLASGTPPKQRSRPSSRDTSPYPRSRPSTPNRPSTPSLSASRPVPPRRSRRTVARSTDRPRGPPELEAALAIAIRNLESDIFEWWCANQKPGSPIPTTAYLKGRSPRVRRAAEAVDEADRMLNEAVYGKPKKPRTVKKTVVNAAQPSENPVGGVSPEAAFEQLELDSPRSSPFRSVGLKTPNSTSLPGSGDGPFSELPGSQDGTGDS